MWMQSVLHIIGRLNAPSCFALILNELHGHVTFYSYAFMNIVNSITAHGWCVTCPHLHSGRCKTLVKIKKKERNIVTDISGKTSNKH